VSTKLCLYAVHDYFKHAGGRDIFLLDWRQVLSYDVSFLNIRIVVNSVINLVNTNLPRTALQLSMFHFSYNFTIIVPKAFNYLKNVTTWEQCSVELDLLRQITILPTKMSDFHR
jgi:hypothetical protein